jgi:hypothetical protein
VESLKPGILKAGILKPGILKPGILKAGILKPGILKAGILKAGISKCCGWQKFILGSLSLGYLVTARTLYVVFQNLFHIKGF